MNPLDQGRRKPKLATKFGLTSGHLTIIGLMIESAKVKQAMEQQDANLVTQIMPIGRGLTRSGLQRDGKIASMSPSDLLRRRKTKNVGRLVLATKSSVQPLEGRIVGQQNVNFTLKPHAEAGAVVETCQTSL